MTEGKNKVVISNSLYYIMVLCLAIYSIVRNTIFAILMVNPEAFISIGMACILLIMIWKKSQYMQIALIGWALFFIIKYGIVFVGLVLAYGYNGFKDVEITVVLEKLVFLIAGIIIWIGSYKYIEIHEPID